MAKGFIGWPAPTGRLPADLVVSTGLYVIRSDIDAIATCELWGAAGATSLSSLRGGAGAYVGADVLLEAGSRYLLYVGAGGQARTSSRAFINGGLPVNENAVSAGGGGGLTGLFNAGQTPLGDFVISIKNAVLVAGSGGGGGYTGAETGGAGGSATGQDGGNATYGGKGGTQSAGGAAGSTGGIAGSALTGGDAGASGAIYGAGGGAGYYGGGGSGTVSGQVGGGGGGSSYARGGVATRVNILAGSGTTPGNSSHALRTLFAAAVPGTAALSQGGHGLAVVTFKAA